MEETIGPFIEWGVAALPLAGEKLSGDAYVMKAWGKKVLAAAIDGLGHGDQAAAVAEVAAKTLINHASDASDVVSLAKRCHEALLRTRGVVLSLAIFDAVNNAMTWLSIGNVDGRLLRADPQTNPACESLFRKGGVVGYQMPSLRLSTTHVCRGDILIFSTDGIRSGFEKEVDLKESPQRIADKILMNYNRKTDDALVLVVRYTGGLS
ncbi:MAG: SpoIIE family protein phosphatase [Syntrophales bacterium]|nr:SpoIIE family protein phosphatase [Syntrophales bacterium]